MDLNSPQDARLRELLDAVRPGSEDLSRSEFADLASRLQRDPQFKEVAQRSQRLDLAIADSLHDLTVPAGAVDRLLARLGAPVGASVEDATQAISGQIRNEPTASRPALPAKIPSNKADTAIAAELVDLHSGDQDSSFSSIEKSGDEKNTRRWSSKLRWLEMAALAAAVCLAATAYLFSGSTVELNADGIIAEAQNFDINHLPGDWNPLANGRPTGQLARFSPSAGSFAGLTAKPSAWREVRGFLGRIGVAYELRNALSHATLYVVDHDAPSPSAPRFVDLPLAPPAIPVTNSTNTGDRSMAAWSQGELVYVLVVDGGAAQFQTFVRQPGQIAAL